MDCYLGPRNALEGLQRVLRHGKARFAGFICRGNDGEQVRQLLDTSLFHMINVPAIEPSASTTCAPACFPACMPW
jgi:hypothetical protein